jgi:hypothetical protein
MIPRSSTPDIFHFYFVDSENGGSILLQSGVRNYLPLNMAHPKILESSSTLL